VNLWDAPFGQPLRVKEITGLSDEVRLVLNQLGLDQGESVEKKHLAPLGDPVSLLIGSQLFSLRAEVCLHVQVQVLSSEPGKA
jgi:Fe2+ transport system protein FeoA